MKALRTLRGKITFFSTMIVVLAMILSAVIVYCFSYHQFVTVLNKNINNEVKLIAVQIEDGFAAIEKDITLIASSSPIQGIVNTSEDSTSVSNNSKMTLKQWKKRLELVFTAILKANPNYTKIRLIGLAGNGKEVVRVNRSNNTIYATHPSALQEKAKAGYFKNTIELNQGSIYFSHINYNEEAGKVTFPLEPTLRVITPIYTNKQEIFGILVINVNIDNYLTNIFLKSDMEYNMEITNNFGDTLVYNHLSNDVTYDPDRKNSILKLKHHSDVTIMTHDIFSDPYKNNPILKLSAIIPNAEMNIGNRYFIEKIFFWLALISFMATFMIYLFSSRLLKNLSDMAQSIRNSTRKNGATTRLPTHLNDEVGLLARAFEEKTKMLDHFASFDSLTGLPNRKNILEHLDEAIIKSKHNISVCACLYIDLNEFKKINDTYGHDYGDELLVKFSATLKKIANEQYFCGRLGGDEFVVIIENIAYNEELLFILEKFETGLNKSFYIKGLTINNIISAGVAIYPEDGKNSDDLLKNADQAMYISKNEGKGKVAFFGGKSIENILESKVNSLFHEDTKQ